MATPSAQPSQPIGIISEGVAYKGLEFRRTIGDVSGMGDVWLAYQPAVKREVAVKVIKPEHANNPDFIRRFEREAQLVARLEHPNIVPLYDFWREPDSAFIVMRYLRGGSLKNQFDNGPQSPQQVFTWLMQVGSALALAHSEGIIHRDIKPANILLDEFGAAYLVDFGIAHVGPTATDEDESGTMGYIAPEQFRGEGFDERSDLFSLGVVLYEMLTGERAFPGLDGIAKLLHSPLPPIEAAAPSLPSALDDVIQKATAKAPSERYETTTALIDAFDAAIGYTSPAVPEPEDPYTVLLDAPNPYRGLRSFQESDEANFFGRTAFIDRMLERLQQPDDSARFLAVVGPSGSGKSSVVKAGLVPRLRQNAIPGSADWFIVEMFPSTRPFDELEAKLWPIAVNPPPELERLLHADDGMSQAINAILPEGTSELLLIIDQFEELFTLTNEAERTAFIAALLDALDNPQSRLRVAITLRADFYDRPLNYLDFGELLRKRTEVVLPMTDDDLRATIVRPAENIGASFEPGLVERMIADVTEEPGGLPLLQYALTELYDRREGRMLTLTAYDALNGITGALAKRADDEYNAATVEQQHTARQIFLRLVTPGEGVEDTRRRVRLSELGDDMVVSGVLDAYLTARLLTTDRDPATREPTVEVAHEALIREWGRLRSWLDANREDLYIQRRLMQDATEWLRSDRDAGLLASGTRLTQFEDYASATTLDLNEEERTYLEASTNERLAREATEQARKAEEARIARRAQNFQRASLILGGLIILALIAGLYGSQVALTNIDAQRNIANTQAAQAVNSANIAATSEFQAQRQADVAQSLALSSQSQLLVDQNQHLSIALGLQAVQIENPPIEAQQTLTEVGLNPGPMKKLVGDDDGEVLSVALSPDGRTIVSGQGDGTVTLWDVASGETLWSIAAHEDELTSVEVSPDGERVISSGFDGQAVIWDVATQQQVVSFDVPSDVVVTSVAYVPDGTQVIAGTDVGLVLAFDSATGELLNALAGHDDFINSVAVSPDGTHALSGSDDTTAILWDLSAGDPIQQLVGHTDWVTGVAFSPIDQTALTGSEDGSVILWDLQTGDLLRTYNEHAGIVHEVAYSPDGRYALSSSDDTSVIVWEVNSGVVLERLVGHIQGVVDVAFHPDGATAISGSYDGSIVVWDLAGAFVQQRYFGHVDWVSQVAYSPDGQQFVSVSADGTMMLWDVASNQPVQQVLLSEERVESAAFSPDGGQVLAADASGRVFLLNVATGEVIHEMQGHGEVDWMRVAYLPDGRHGASGGNDGRLVYWDLQTGEAVQTIAVPAGGIRGVTITPDEQFIATATDAGQLLIWELFADTPTHTFEVDAGVVIAAFSSDMRMVAGGTTDGEIIIWDLATGEVIHRLFGHREFVFGLAFHPNGERLYSGSTDTDVLTWDVRSGSIIHRFTAHTDVVTDIEISPDGQTALTASDDRTVIAWDLRDDLDTVEARADWICANRAVASLSDIEQRTFQLDEIGSLCR